MLGLGNLWRSESRVTLKLFVIALACALCAASAIALLCLAGFVAALERFGLVDACLVTAAAFLVAALLLGTVEAALAERRRRRRREALAAAAPLATLADPRAIFIALQIAQTVGFRRVAPLLAIGVTAFALGAARRDGSRRGAVKRRDRHPPGVAQEATADRIGD